MKIDDLIESPLSKYGMGSPMGVGKHISNKLKSFVPGGVGARAQGDLDAGRVANQWKKEYMQYVGRVGASKNGSTETLTAFLKTKNFTPQQIKKVIPESKSMYEADLGVGQIDDLMMKAARISFAGDNDIPLPADPNPTAPREPGVIDKAVDISKQVAPKVAKTAGNVGAKLGQKAFDYGKQLVTKKLTGKTPATTRPAGRIEPTIGIPTASAPTQPVASPKFTPARQAPKMKTQPVRKFRED
jgi:hypothetical protein